MTDGAMPGRAERHKQLISARLLESRLSVGEEEWQLRFLNLTGKTKYRTPLSTKRLLSNVFNRPATKLVLSDSDYT